MSLTVPNLVTIIVYALFVAGTVISLFTIRNWSTANFSKRESQEEWQQWRSETERQEMGSGPVQRRKAKSVEPPTLVLMRDYFALMLATAILLGTVLYWAIAMMLRGAFATSSVPLGEREENKSDGNAG